MFITEELKLWATGPGLRFRSEAFSEMFGSHAKELDLPSAGVQPDLISPIPHPNY
jgi:hypothetical protein